MAAPNPVGRPTACTPELKEQARQYIYKYDDYGHVVPSAVGLCKILNVARSMLYRWADEEGNEFRDILDSIMDYQRFELTNKGLKGETNSVITKLMLTKHGYSDKQEIKAEVNDYTNLEGDDLDRKIKEMQQKLDDSSRD